MEFTLKQKVYIEYMLKRIGFNETDICEYLEIFSTPFNRDNFKLTNQENWYFNTGNCIEAIKSEFDLKKSLSIKDKNILKFISATDISNFVFCPANYSINNSFEIELPTGMEQTEEGKKLHEELRAIKKSWVRQKDDEILEKNQDLSLIKKSKILFIGHNSDNKIFKNDNWIGQPDYILASNNGDCFVVEEKYRYIPDPGKKTGNYYNMHFYSWDFDEREEETYRNIESQWKKSNVLFYKNNIFQIVSYIHNIKEYDLKFGILIYWYYDYDSDNKPYIHKVATKRILLNNALIEEYSQIKKSIEKLLNNEEVDFKSTEINFKKCTNCVVSKYCGHKTKQYTMIKLPYDKNHQNLKFEPFPEILKKNKT